METKVKKSKIQTNFRLNEKLLTALKKEAKNENRSLNNYVEVLLSQAVFKRYNAETMQAIEDIEAGRVEAMGDIDEFFDGIKNEQL